MQQWRKARIPEGLATANRISGTPWYEGGEVGGNRDLVRGLAAAGVYGLARLVWMHEGDSS